jgi:hypothetical protein
VVREWSDPQPLQANGASQATALDVTIDDAGNSTVVWFEREGDRVRPWAARTR